MLEVSAIENLCSRKKWSKFHQHFYVMLSSKTFHHAKFHREGQTSLEIGGVSFGPRTKKYFVTDGQKRDYLSRHLQRARGATKNSQNVPLYTYLPRNKQLEYLAVYGRASMGES